MNLNFSECLCADVRERMIAENLEIARSARGITDAYWRKMRSYYDGAHETASQTGGLLSTMELPWRPCSVPDGFLHVEGQIEAVPPDFEFSAQADADAPASSTAKISYVTFYKTRI